MASRHKRGHAGGSAAAAGLAALEQRLGYTFRDTAILTLALTHRSHEFETRGEDHRDARNRPGTDNEQLEFLGDAVLGLAVSELAVECFPDRDEGELTRIRAALVSRKRMAQFGAELELGEHLLLGRSAEEAGARRRPALLANAAEAVLAAIYLDAVRHGADGLTPVRNLVRSRLVDPEMETIRRELATSGRGAMRDPKTLLQELVQAEAAGRLRYVDLAQSGPAHERSFQVEVRLEREHDSVVLADAEGPSKREAQQRAAEQALARWNHDPSRKRPHTGVQS